MSTGGASGRTTITLADVGEIDVHDAGAGAPLLFLHGGEGPASEAFLAALRPARVIAPELPGIGSTPIPPAWNEVDDLADFASDVLDALGVDRADVVGHSFGGYIAAKLAVRCRHRIDHLVLSAPIGAQVEGIVLPQSFSLEPAKLARTLGYPEPEQPPPLRLAEREVLARFLFAEPFDRSLLRRLRRVRRPALVLRGGNDQLLPAAYVRAFAEALSAEYRELPDLPHAMPHLAPAELAKAIRAFLDEE